MVGLIYMCLACLITLCVAIIGDKFTVKAYKMMKGFKPRGKVIMIAFGCHLELYVALMLANLLLAFFWLFTLKGNRPQMTLAPGHN